MAEKKKLKLGKGLGALMSGKVVLDPAPSALVRTVTAGPKTPAKLSDGSELLMVDPTDVLPNPKQPRHTFNEESLAELAESIRRDGLQEPIIVRRAGDKFELVSGERRCRASVLADIKEIPAVCREVSDRDMLKLGLIENIQREDLNAIEVARAYQDLIQQFNWTQEQLADEVGKKRATVANSLRLLQLPELVQKQVADDLLTMGHARALLAVPSPVEQAKLARKVVKEELSVRQTEQMAAALSQKAGKAVRAAKAKDPNVSQIEDDLRRKLGTRVCLRTGKEGKGRIEIDYYSLDELDRLLALLRGR